jgi:hypothetical protein
MPLGGTYLARRQMRVAKADDRDGGERWANALQVRRGG